MRRWTKVFNNIFRFLLVCYINKCICFWWIHTGQNVSVPQTDIFFRRWVHVFLFSMRAEDLDWLCLIPGITARLWLPALLHHHQFYLTYRSHHHSKTTTLSKSNNFLPIGLWMMSLAQLATQILSFIILNKYHLYLGEEQSNLIRLSQNAPGKA